ncbi:MAG: anaerobic ribonucleoside-triphosphate reductase activating protein [Cellulosilyticaceae bacterium]
MYYAAMRKFDVANGTGIRTTLFVSGCTHQCKGCFNTQYRHFTYGTPWNQEAEDLFVSYAKDPNVHGVTILGGEPFQQTQDTDLLNLLKRIKTETDQTIWIYSGYTFEEIISDPDKLELLKVCDVLVDGPFAEELKNIQLKFRGSSNQRIINIQDSLTQQQPILLEL